MSEEPGDLDQTQEREELADEEGERNERCDQEK